MGLTACMVWTAKGRAGIGESIVFRRRRAEMRLSPRLNLIYEDLLEDAEWRDEAGEVKEAVASDEVWVGPCCPLELSEGD